MNEDTKQYHKEYFRERFLDAFIDNFINFFDTKTKHGEKIFKVYTKFRFSNDNLEYFFNNYNSIENFSKKVSDYFYDKIKNIKNISLLNTSRVDKNFSVTIDEQIDEQNFGYEVTVYIDFRATTEVINSLCYNRIALAYSTDLDVQDYDDRLYNIHKLINFYGVIP